MVSLDDSDQPSTLLRLLVESVQDYAIFALDVNGHVISWNEGAHRIKGYEAREIIGKHFSVFYPPEDVRLGKCERELAAAAREGRWEDEGLRIRKDGTSFWANVVITALRDPKRGLVGFAKVTRDLTARRHAEEDRLRLAKAEEALRLRDEFLSVAAHELRTPLTSLLLQVQGLAQSPTLDPKLRPKVSRVERAARRVNGLVTSLLDVSRISTGRLTLNVTRSDLVAMTREVVDLLAERAAEVGASLVLDAHVQQVWGEWDVMRVEQLLTNVVDNAIKYGGPHPIELTIDRNDADAVVAVRDHGPGIDPKDATRIFERFERAESASKLSGLGLGLYVSRAIAEAHRATISFENAAGGGARFTIGFPLQPTLLE